MLFDSLGDTIICDGAMGTMLQKRGLKPGERSDIMTMTSPDAVEEIHRLYVEAGSDIIYTNTLGANALSLNGTGFSPRDVITQALAIAKRAAGGSALVALDLGPTGALLEPLGDLGFERAYELFKEQVLVGKHEGADLAVAETMSDINELKAAVLDAQENSDLPVMATMTFDSEGKTYLGCTPEIFAETAEKLGVSAIGLNCSLSPSQMLSTVERLAKATALPIVIKPNAGFPDSVTGEYNIDAAEFARQMLELTNAAAYVPTSVFNMVSGTRKVLAGGCCGTTPEYIHQLRELLVL